MFIISLKKFLSLQIFHSFKVFGLGNPILLLLLTKSLELSFLWDQHDQLSQLCEEIKTLVVFHKDLCKYKGHTIIYVWAT